MDLGLTVLANADSAMYLQSVCHSGATDYCVTGTPSNLSTVYIDVYAQPTNTPYTFLTNQVAPFFSSTNLLCCKGQWGVEETVPPDWVYANTPQERAHAYRERANNDWNRYGVDKEWLKSWVMWFAAHGSIRLGLFNTAKLIWYTTSPSCPNGPNVPPASCGTPDLTCASGSNANQCYGDIVIQNPYIINFANQLTNNGAGVTPFGIYWKGLANGWYTGGSF